MSDWDSDTFMSNWDKTYVSTNLKAGTQAYDATVFKDLQRQLDVDVRLKDLGPQILVSRFRLEPLFLYAGHGFQSGMTEKRKMEPNRPWRAVHSAVQTWPGNSSTI